MRLILSNLTLAKHRIQYQVKLLWVDEVSYTYFEQCAQVKIYAIAALHNLTNDKVRQVAD